VTKTYFDSPVEMESLFTSVVLMDMLKEIFDQFCDNMIQLFIYPIIDDSQMDVKVTLNSVKAILVCENPNHISKRTKVVRPSKF
jgi:hypothetical protein